MFKGLKISFYKIDAISSETRAVKDFVEQTKSDLVSFANHKYNFFQKLIEQDEKVINKITFSSEVPILI